MYHSLYSDILFGSHESGNMDEQQENNLGSRFFQLVLTVYGPYAFGIATLLVIWFAIVSPQLASQAIDYKKNEEIVSAMRSIVASQEQVAKTLERTAIVLDELVEQIKSHVAQAGPVPR